MQEISKNLISDTSADRLIAAHDGNVTLLFLWLRRRGSFDAEKAAGELCLTLSEVKNAYEKLCRMGLSDSEAEKMAEPKPFPEEEHLEYSSADIIRRTQEDSGFKAVLAETEKKLGRLLSTADTRILFSIYDYLALPPDVIFVLLTYCIDLFAEKYGPGRLPSMRSIEKEAYSWANKEILTLDQAEEFLRNATEKRSEAAKVKQTLGIVGRATTPTETKYIDAWLDMGFGAEAIAIAYDRTVTNTGSLKWNYMNKIISSWHEKGLFDPAEIESKDGRSQSQKPENAHKAAASADELGRLRSIYDKIKKG